MGRHDDYRDRSGKHGKHKKRDSRSSTPQKHHKKYHGKSHHDSHKHGKHKTHYDHGNEFSDSDDIDYDDYDEEKGYSKRRNNTSYGKKKQGFKENIKQKFARKLKWNKGAYKKKVIEADDEDYEDDDDDETDMYDDIEHGIKKKAKKARKVNAEGGSSDDGILLGYPSSRKKKSKGSCFYILIVVYILIAGLVIAGLINYEKLLPIMETYKSKIFGVFTNPASEDSADVEKPAETVVPKGPSASPKGPSASPKGPSAGPKFPSKVPRANKPDQAKPKPSLGLEFVKPATTKDKVPYSGLSSQSVGVYYHNESLENSSIHSYSRLKGPLDSYLMTNPISVLEEPSVSSETSEDSFIELNDIMTKEERAAVIQELNRKGRVTKSIVDLTYSSIPSMHKNNLEKGTLGTLSLLNTNHINRDLIEMQFSDYVENIEESKPEKRGFFSYISSLFIKSTNESANAKEFVNANGLITQRVGMNKMDKKLPEYMLMYFQSETFNLNPAKQKVKDQTNIGASKGSGSGMRFRRDRGENTSYLNLAESPVQDVETKVAGHFFDVIKEKISNNLYKSIGLIILVYLLLIICSSLIRKCLKFVGMTLLRLFICCCCGRN